MTDDLDPYKLCWQQEVSIRSTAGTHRVQAWVCAGLAVHRAIDGEHYVMMHLPSGLALSQAGVFDHERKAVEAMVVLGRGRNDWILETEEDREAFSDAVHEVFRLAGARPRWGRGPMTPLLPRDLNGFADG